MKKKSMLMLCSILCCSILSFSAAGYGAPEENVPKDARCLICGMFVAKYDDWVTQVHLADNSVRYFDGVKDMLVFYFNPEKYGKFEQQDIREIWVKDYYTLQWQDGLKAFYVVGSDVYGPMGNEFIAFTTRDGAENFLKDHKGTEVLVFDEITDELVQSMRTTKMRHGKE
ncbi:MAG: nitrous oxide reductase accessory protein NosL [Desulfobulbaceae bacterium]|nr:nitrous oxide reductase accessory protein NosL [Desulfobulbaceae bacterium]